ncbi:hypothetical protein NGC05_03665 [Staphylococcus succinus]|uniref:hypothetical protein n=1 Tax=Staphylococcus succinus TaxID=61015 RepID=UPI002DBC8B72|nr:hypothetical protein [Staphylococcus succinus]MEB7461779.1 hypothetical protein [Staphylococcus succinus]
MKKILFLLMTSFLILTACGNSEGSKSEDKKETKSSSKDDKKKDENKKPKDDKEETNKKETSNVDNAQRNDTQQANTEQQTQSVEQLQSKQEPIQSQEQAQSVEEQNTQHSNQEPTKEEIAEWDRQNISGGTDAGLFDSDAAYKQMKKEEEANVADQEAKEEKLHDEYNALTEQMYGENSNLSESEIEKLEEKQDAILDQVEPIN